MITIVLIFHVIISIALIAVVLLQRSEGGALGIGGNPAGGLMSGRGAASVLTRTTAILATVFIINSIALALLAGGKTKNSSILDNPPALETKSEPSNKNQSKQPKVPLSQ
tara:strand:+ start:1736 stop:2065 length:330 start_codon:yes stop_codon:yes gene_type:complete